MLFRNAQIHNVDFMPHFKQAYLQPQQPEGDSFPTPPYAEEGYLLSRVPDEVRQQLNPFAKTAVFQGTGSEIRFNLHGDKAYIELCRVSSPDESFSIAEVYYGAFQGHLRLSPKVVTTGAVTVLEIVYPTGKELDQLIKASRMCNAPYDPMLIRVLLPYDLPNILFDIRGDISPPRPDQLPKLTYYAYGSSITHGSVSVRPSGTYAHRIAQGMKADLYNKAFPGSAHMDDAVAYYLAAQQWDFMTVEMGINVVYQITPEDFEDRVSRFLDILVQAHADRWIFCTDMIPFMMDVEGDPKANIFREIVKAKVYALNSPKVVYISGLELMSDVSGLTVDILHPSAGGEEQIAQNFLQVIRKHIAMK